MKGTLYIVATPIGNLEDMTFRAVRTLKEADLIAAEDTRTSKILMDRYDIPTPMTSYHKFNEKEKSGELVTRLMEGKNIAVVTDAGTPGISDPGEILVKLCHENGITVTSIPGASACITALSMSGQDTRRFVFEGFLPAEKKERDEVLEMIKNETRTMVFYEAPHRILKTLKLLLKALDDRKITICRELTKKFETVTETTFAKAIEYYTENAPKGEFVVVVAGKDQSMLQAENAAKWEKMSLEEHVSLYEEQGMDRKEAMKAVAKDRGISRRDVYNGLLRSRD